jgi:3',5'-cyclic AMP phosphodiesterase CpdA
MGKIFKEHPLRSGLACLFILSFIVLQIWKSYASLAVSDWNKNEISKIKIADPEDFTFAVFGDNKGNYSFFEPLLNNIAQDHQIAFAVDIGDLVSNGKRGQYRRFLNQVQENLKIPFITAIGNHDLNGGGSENYREIFGPTYYAFQIGQSYFIVLDATTEAGFDKTERKWLEEELQKSQASKARFIFMHVPAFDPRGNGFNYCLNDGKDLLGLFRRYKVTHLFASHIHGYFSGIWDGVPYTITGGAGGRLKGSDPQHFFHHYIKVHINNGKVELTVRRINLGGIMATFFDLLEDYGLDWGLLLGAGILLLTVGLTIKKRTI